MHFPVQRMLHNRREIVIARLPSKFSTDEACIGIDRGAVITSPWPYTAFEVPARDILNHIENLFDRIAPTIAAVSREVLAPRPQMAEGCQVSSDQIINVNVIAHTGNV